jgi:hypothetical protein
LFVEHFAQELLHNADLQIKRKQRQTSKLGLQIQSGQSPSITKSKLSRKKKQATHHHISHQGNYLCSLFNKIEGYPTMLTCHHTDFQESMLLSSHNCSKECVCQL